jgi:transcriptional regulator with XRE-family HTH domain
MTNRVIIAYKQCRAARELLGWKQNDLAEKSSISAATIADFERGVRELRVSTLEKLINTFEDAGIKFENDEVKYGVELLKKFEDKD